MFYILSYANSKVYTNKDSMLMWQNIKNKESIAVDWYTADKYCNNLSLLGKHNWRLAKLTEYFSLVNSKTLHPNNKRYWTSSSRTFDFLNWTSYPWNKRWKYNVLCVRSILNDLSFYELVSYFSEIELKAINKPPRIIKLAKGEFETTKEFEKKVLIIRKEQNKVNKKYQRDKQDVKKIAIKKALLYTWSKPILSNLKYDADNGYFVANLKFEAKKSFDKKVAIKVERKYARDFKKQFYNLKPQAIFNYDGKIVTLKDIKIPYKSQSFIVQFTDMNIDDTKVAVNISNEFDTPTYLGANIIVAKSSVSNFDASKLKDYKVLDRLLAKTSQKRVDSKKWLFVVGIEQYEYTDNISYASRSANMFKKVMKKKIGIKESNCYTMINSGATQAKIKTSLKKMLRRVKEGDTIYFYYNGHGVPVPSKKFEPYMLTADTEPDFVADEDFFALKNIYGKLSFSKAKKVIAVVDSCFSGVTDGKAVLKGVAATKMKARTVAFDKEKMVVLSAGKGHQYSNGYDKKGHRLFSFYIMKNILEGDTTVKSLYKDTKKQTYQTSLEEYGDSRTQEPTLQGNGRMKL